MRHSRTSYRKVATPAANEPAAWVSRYGPERKRSSRLTMRAMILSIPGWRCFDEKLHV